MFLLAIITFIIIAVAIIIWIVTRKSKSSKHVEDTFQAINTVDNLIKNNYCGVIVAKDKQHNSGPLWKVTLQGTCANNEQDFWLSGNLLEPLINLVELTGKSTLNIDRVLNDVFSKEELLTQLVSGYNGTWNDDRLWWALSFLKLYEYDSKRFSKGLDWAEKIWQDIYKNNFNSFNCKGKVYYSTWWQIDTSDPKGERTYRNTITNSLFMELTLKLYDHMEKEDKKMYWDVAVKCIDFLTPLLSNQDGLMLDGWNRGNNSCEATGAYYTYNQGIILDAFARAAVIYTSQRNISKATILITFITNLFRSTMQKLTVPNTSILVEPAVTTIEGNQSPAAFKGIYCRYLSYVAQTLATHHSLLKDLHIPVDVIVKEAPSFLDKNSQQMTNIYRDGMYAYVWTNTKEQTRTAPVWQFTTATTFSVIDLINAYYTM